jgi:hypothetical protein
MKRTLTLAALSFLAISAHAQFLSYTTAGTVTSQNFDALSAGGLWTNLSLVPGVAAFTQVLSTKAAGSTISTINLGTGTTTGAGLYSFGSSVSSSNRSLGVVASNTFSGNPGGSLFGFGIVNNTGFVQDKITFSYTGRQWRNNGNAAAHKLEFDYAINGSGFLNAQSSYVLDSSMDFTSTVNTATAAAVDGLTVFGVRTLTLTGITWNPGDTFIARWYDANDTGNDHTLAIDDISFEAVPEPFTMSALALGLAAIARKRARRN